MLNLSVSMTALRADMDLGCSVGMVHWPETIAVHLMQSRWACDQLLGEATLAAPGQDGRPAVDPVPQVLQWEGRPQSAFKPLWLKGKLK